MYSQYLWKFLRLHILSFANLLINLNSICRCTKKIKYINFFVQLFSFHQKIFCTGRFKIWKKKKSPKPLQGNIKLLCIYQQLIINSSTFGRGRRRMVPSLIGKFEVTSKEISPINAGSILILKRNQRLNYSNIKYFEKLKRD